MFCTNPKGLISIPTKLHQNPENKRQRQLPQRSLTSHQLSSGRRIVRTRNFCALQRTCCVHSKFACNWTEIGSIADPSVLEVEQQKFFLPIQNDYFSLERKSLLKSSRISKISTIPKLFHLFGHNGLIRAKRRTQLVESDKFEKKHPVILDARHPLVGLFLQHLHERHCHHVVEYLRASTRQKSSILKFRKKLMFIRWKCVTSRNCKVKFVAPFMVDLLQ